MVSARAAGPSSGGLWRAPFCGILRRKGDVYKLSEKYKCPYCGVAFYEASDNTKERRISYNFDQKDFDGPYGYNSILSDIVAVYHTVHPVMNIPYSLPAARDFFFVQLSTVYRDNIARLYSGSNQKRLCGSLLNSGCKSKSICHIIASLPAGNDSGFLGRASGNLAGEIDLIKDKNSCRPISGTQRRKALGKHWSTHGKGCESDR